MGLSLRKSVWASLVLSVAAMGTVSFADTPATDVNSELAALKARIAELEKKDNENWMTEQRAEQIKAVVRDVIADAKSHGQFLDTDLAAGYGKDGFFLASADKNFRLAIGGFLQFRYVTGNYYNRGINGASSASNPFNTNGFELRRARVNFSGNAFSPDIFFKFEGDFAGSYGPGNSPNSSSSSTNTNNNNGNNGSFQVTDAYIGYRFSDTFKIKAGSFKVPFAKAELTSDTAIGVDERPDELFPFDPVRAVGISLFGDIHPDTLNYEVNVNNGGRNDIYDNRISDTSASANLDNRLAFYTRFNWAGAGKISDFSDEPDLRKDTSEFAWLLGAAVGYDSENSTVNARPHGQSFDGITGVAYGTGSGGTGGFTSGTLNGDLYRATIDWSAKYQGWSFLTAAYFQEVNQNAGTFTSSSGVPFIAGKANFFEHAYYGQVGYFVLPKKLELVGRVGTILTEGGKDSAEYYTIGANYYLFGHGAKIQSDVTWVPNYAAFSDASSDQVQNTSEIIYRLQLQVKF